MVLLPDYFFGYAMNFTVGVQSSGRNKHWQTSYTSNHLQVGETEILGKIHLPHPVFFAQGTGLLQDYVLFSFYLSR